MNALPRFRALLLACALLASAACSSKKDDPAAATPATADATATYTDPNGQQTAVASCKALSVTATPVQAGARRAFVVRATLPNGTTLDVTYRYVGAMFPGVVGPVALNESVIVENYSAAGTISHYEAPVSTGTLSVDSITPQVISGTYTGPLVAGGASAKLVFTKLAI